MTRVCFTLRLRPELIDEYVERHRAVWPEMLREIAASGRRDYTIHLAPDGLLVGVYEVDDPVASAEYLARSAVASAWEAESSRFFSDLDGRADQGAVELPAVFDLEAQLAALDGGGDRV